MYLAVLMFYFIMCCMFFTDFELLYHMTSRPSESNIMPSTIIIIIDKPLAVYRF